MRAVFVWLDAHPRFYWLGAASATLALLCWIATESRRSPRPDRPSRCAEVIFAGLVLLVLIAWRWPYLFAANEYNPDESQLIAGALTLWHDPVPWRSLDVATSGPLNYYALFPLHLLGLPFDYFTARLTGLALVWGALLACHRLFRAIGGPSAAHLAILPALVFFAGASDGDLIHYSSEHVPVFLTALAGAGLFAFAPGASPTRWIVTGGLAAGLLPWAKLQAAPFLVVLAALKLGQLLMARDAHPPARRREAGMLAAALALPSGLALSALAVTGQLETFWRSYLQANTDYVRDAPAPRRLLGQFLEVAGERGNLIAYGVTALFLLLLGAILYRCNRQRPGRLFVLGLLGLLCAAGCVLTPQRPLLHYVLLAIVPLTWWTGAAITEVDFRTSPGGRVLAGLFALAALVPLAWSWHQEDPDELGRLATDWRQPRSLVGRLLRDNRVEGDALAVWGWWPSLYVDAGLPQGTHDGNTSWSMPLAAASQRSYYQERFLHDLSANRPRFFVDAVGPGAPFFADRTLSAHEGVPALAQLIHENYRLWLDIGEARLFVRRDAPPPPAISPDRLEQLRREARRGAALAPSFPATILPAGAPVWNVRGRQAQMMMPETAVTWTLDGTERAVWIDYGFHPQARDRSNGAVLVGELRSETRPPQLIFRRVLDPVRNPADRRPLLSRLVLPPFAPGSRFVLRTEAGENNDSAWDWVYVQRARFLRSPGFQPEQFPGFNRVPDSATGNQPALIDGPAGRYLSLQAPAELGFVLRGSENALRFGYGFEPGAYEGSGHTDGAAFLVEMQRANGVTDVLFRRVLQPGTQAGDRGPQEAVVAIPAGLAGSRLLVRIDPGPSDSWDWTYVRSLELR